MSPSPQPALPAAPYVQPPPGAVSADFYLAVMRWYALTEKAKR